MISAPRSAEALEEYKRALEVTAASKAAIHQVVPAGVSLTEVVRAKKFLLWLLRLLRRGLEPLFSSLPFLPLAAALRLWLA